MANYLWLLAAGGLGAVCRYLLADTVQRLYGGSFPVGTLAANVAGCFAFGLIWALTDGRSQMLQTRLIVLTGFMGAFTTFSTYAFETDALLKKSSYWAALINLAANNALGLLAVAAGIALGIGIVRSTT